MASGADRDRISDLPEGVLHHILSLLPARDAVRTCVLAQSWRDRWRSAPALRFACSSGYSAFGRFVDGLLRARHGGPPLDLCDFDLDVACLKRCFFRLNLHGNAWIHRVLQLNVRELRFRVSGWTSPFSLEDGPFSSQHLTRLELTDVEVGELDFSGCPALESLKMEETGVWALDMQSPTLKHLSIKSCSFYIDYRTRMSFPSLVSFEFLKNTGYAPMLQRMLHLETAVVRFNQAYLSYWSDRCTNGRLDDCADEDCMCCNYYSGRHGSGSGSVFLHGLAEATYLKLSACPDMYVFNRDLKWCPAFNKLKTLVLSDWFLSTDLTPLIWFLHHTPLLEKLTLKISMAQTTLMDIEGSYNPFEKYMAPSHLQTIEIICKYVDEILLKVLKVLNANGIPLGKIRIQCSGCYNFGAVWFTYLVA